MSISGVQVGFGLYLELLGYQLVEVGCPAFVEVKLFIRLAFRLNVAFDRSVEGRSWGCPSIRLSVVVSHA